MDYPTCAYRKSQWNLVWSSSRRRSRTWSRLLMRTTMIESRPYQGQDTLTTNILVHQQDLQQMPLNRLRTRYGQGLRALAMKLPRALLVPGPGSALKAVAIPFATSIQLLSFKTRHLNLISAELLSSLNTPDKPKKSFAELGSHCYDSRAGSARLSHSSTQCSRQHGHYAPRYSSDSW